MYTCNLIFASRMKNNPNPSFPILYFPKTNRGEQKETLLTSKNFAKADSFIFANYIQNPPTYEWDILSTDMHIEIEERNKSQISKKSILVSELLLSPEFMDSQKISNFTNKNHIIDLRLVPLSSNSDGNKGIDCFCKKVMTDANLIECSMCRSKSHLKCYRLLAKKLPPRFICFRCQYNFVKTVQKIVLSYTDNVHDILGKCFEKLDEFIPFINDIGSDALININGEKEIRNFIHAFFLFCNLCDQAWEAISFDWTVTQNILYSYLMNQPNDR